MVDNDEPLDDSALDDEKFVERAVQVNPNVIENYWQEGKAPLCYFKKWRRLHLRVDDFKFIHTYQFFETEWGSELDDLFDEDREAQGLEPKGKNEAEKERKLERRELRHLSKRAREDFDALSEDEQQTFRWAHAKEVQPMDQRRGVSLVGWGEIENSRAIRVFSVDKKSEPDEVNYDRTFDRVKLTIREVEDDRIGALHHWIEDLRLYDQNDPGEDYLIAEMFVKEGCLTELETEIRQRGGKVPINVIVEAHLFQYEVDESLAEPYHFQTYDMLYDNTCSIILNTINVGKVPKYHPKQELLDDSDDYLGEERYEEETDPEEQLREQLLSNLANTNVSLRDIKNVLWVVAIVLLLSLFV